MEEKAKKKHTVRNIVLIILAVVIVGAPIVGLVQALYGSNNLAGEWKVIGLQTGFEGYDDKNENYDFIDVDSSKALYANFDKEENTLTIYDKTEDNEIKNVYFKLPYYGYKIGTKEIKTTKFTLRGIRVSWRVKQSYEKGDEYVCITYGAHYSREYYGNKEQLQTEINEYKGDYITRFSLVKEDYDYKANVKLDEVSAGTTYSNKKEDETLTIKEINKVIRPDGVTVYSGTLNRGFDYDEEFIIEYIDSDGAYCLSSTHGDTYDSYIIIKADANNIVLRPNTSMTYNGFDITSDEHLYSYLYTYAK